MCSHSLLSADGRMIDTKWRNHAHRWTSPYFASALPSRELIRIFLMLAADHCKMFPVFCETVVWRISGSEDTSILSRLSQSRRGTDRRHRRKTLKWFGHKISLNVLMNKIELKIRFTDTRMSFRLLPSSASQLIVLSL